MTRANDPLDTYMLRVLVSLLTEHNLTRVAAQMNQTQPAISAALRKLRLVFNDELLVRNGNTMAVTPRGLEVLETARSVLADIDRLLAGGITFDPGNAQQLFKVGCPDYLSTVFMAGVVQEFRRQAPNARLLVHPLGPGFDFEAALASGELDVVIGNWPEPPESLHAAPLLVDDIVCLMDRNNSLAHSPMTREQYLQAPHIVPLPFSSSHRGVIDKHLAGMRVTRNARITVPLFSMAPNLIAGTDLIFTISRHFAAHYAAMLPLSVVPCPIDFPVMRFYLLWHGRNQRSAAQRWLRSVLTDVAGLLVPGA